MFRLGVGKGCKEEGWGGEEPQRQESLVFHHCVLVLHLQLPERKRMLMESPFRQR